MKYSVIMYNFNDYELMHPLPKDAINADIEFIYVTDNPSIHGNGWNIIIDDSLAGLSPFDQCYAVRFNLFKYTSTDICLYIDGSMQIRKNILPLFNQFEQSNADLGLMIHPDRSTMWDEYCTWFQIRKYPPKQGYKCMAYMAMNGYDIHNYRGLYQGGLRFIRNTKRNKQLDQDTYNTLKMLGNNGIIERLDQTIHSYFVNTKYTDVAVFPFSQHWIQSQYIGICPHRSLTIAQPREHINSTGYLRNKLVNLDTCNF